MVSVMPSLRVSLGIATSISIFFALRLIDEYLLHPVFPGASLVTLTFDSTRLVLSVFASVAVGSYVARRGLMLPMVVLVSAVWGFGLVNTYAHRDDYSTTLRVIDLAWPEVIMVIVATVVAVKVGERIANSVRQNSGTET